MENWTVWVNPWHLACLLWRSKIKGQCRSLEAKHKVTHTTCPIKATVCTTKAASYPTHETALYYVNPPVHLFQNIYSVWSRSPRWQAYNQSNPPIPSPRDWIRPWCIPGMCPTTELWPFPWRMDTSDVALGYTYLHKYGTKPRAQESQFLQYLKYQRVPRGYHVPIY